MIRVLILGFSVTADREGYSEYVRDLSQRSTGDGITVEICGVGGLNPLVLAVLYEGLVQKIGVFDYVFLEIATSIFGTKITDWQGDALSLLYDLCGRIHSNGTRLGFINLYRDDFDYSYHVYDMLIESVAARYNVPLLDLGAGLLRREGKEFCRSLLRDKVHTVGLGAKYQGDIIWKFIRSVVLDARAQDFFPSPKFSARSANLLSVCRDHFPYTFSRSGLILECGVLQSEESCEIAVPDHAQLYGISFLSHPTCGQLVLQFNGINKVIVVQTYDEQSYYTRYAFRRFGLINGCLSVRITQDKEIPSIGLMKGEPNYSERIGYVVALHYFRREFV